MSAGHPENVVLPVNFQARSGAEFERLCFAYLLRIQDWKSIEWYGQRGGDAGRDIWAVERGGTTHCFQCANRRRLTFRKASEDIRKLVEGRIDAPNVLTFIVGGAVSAGLRDRVREEARAAGIEEVRIWGGVEFEERIRRDKPELLRRFVHGEPFPEGVAALVAQEPVFFASLQVSPSSLWRAAHRLHKLPLQGRPQLDVGFHEMHPREWAAAETRGIDPVFDVVLKNAGAQAAVVSAIGLLLLDQWTDLKGLRLSEPIPLQEGIVLKLGRFRKGQVQRQALECPRSLPAEGGLLRSRLTLQGFRKAIRGNESIVRLVADVDGGVVASRPFYMGRY